MSVRVGESLRECGSPEWRERMESLRRRGRKAKGRTPGSYESERK